MTVKVIHFGHHFLATHFPHLQQVLNLNLQVAGLLPENLALEQAEQQVEAVMMEKKLLVLIL